MDVFAVEGKQVFPCDGLDRVRRRVAVAEMVLPVHQKAPFNPGNRSGRVVAAFHILQHPVLGHAETLPVEPWMAKHLNEQPEPLINVLGQAEEPGLSARLADPAVQRGGEEFDSLVQLFRGEVLRPAVAHLLTSQRRQTDLLRRLDRGPGANRDRHVERWEHAVFGDVHHHPVGKYVPEL